jgi:hypothetical protein
VMRPPFNMFPLLSSTINFPPIILP